MYQVFETLFRASAQALVVYACIAPLYITVIVALSHWLFAYDDYNGEFGFRAPVTKTKILASGLVWPMTTQSMLEDVNGVIDDEYTPVFHLYFPSVPTFIIGSVFSVVWWTSTIIGWLACLGWISRKKMSSI